MKLANMVEKKGGHSKTSPGVMLDSKEKGPTYPWGLRLNLDHDTLTKLGVKDLPKVGSHVHIHAKAHVQSISQNAHKSDGGKPNRSVELQIHHMAIGKGGATSALDAVNDGVDEASGE